MQDAGWRVQRMHTPGAAPDLVSRTQRNPGCSSPTSWWPPKRLWVSCKTVGCHLHPLSGSDSLLCRCTEIADIREDQADAKEGNQIFPKNCTRELVFDSYLGVIQIPNTGVCVDVGPHKRRDHAHRRHGGCGVLGDFRLGRQTTSSSFQAVRPHNWKTATPTVTFRSPSQS